MKMFREIIIVFGIYFFGEACSVGLHLPLPGSLVGMIVLLLLLRFHIVKLEQISTISDFLLGHLPFFFIPAGVALMSVFPQIAHNWVWILLICCVTTFFTMGFTGFCVQRFMERKSR